MLSQQYQKMLGQKSVIREMFMYSRRRAAEIGAENVFDYSLGNPSVPTPASFTREMQRLLAEEEPVALHGYSPSLGIPQVREALAQSLQRRFGLPYKQEHIFMTTGAAGAIAHALRCVTQPGDVVLGIAPYFPEYGPYVEGAGCTLQLVPPDTEHFQIQWDALEAMLTDRVAALMINTPNNPSGAAYSAATLTRLAELLTTKSAEYGHTIYLISDEPYREIVFAGADSPYVACFYPHTLTCYSFSKSLSLPGERIGYLAICPADPDAELMVEMCGQISRGTGHNCPPSIIQLAVAAVADETADLSVYERNMEILYAELTRLGFTCAKPSGTFYIFPQALEADATAFCQKALEYDLVLVPSESFGCPGHFRMAYCMDTEKVERSLPALRRLAAAYGH